MSEAKTTMPAPEEILRRVYALATQPNRITEADIVRTLQVTGFHYPGDAEDALSLRAPWLDPRDGVGGRAWFGVNAARLGLEETSRVILNFSSDAGCIDLNRMLAMISGPLRLGRSNHPVERMEVPYFSATFLVGRSEDGFRTLSGTFLYQRCARVLAITTSVDERPFGRTVQP